MSGVDPLAALAVEAALQQSALAAIDLGVQIELLQSQLTVGDLISATILPPQGGADRLSLLGQTVLAQLPPGIDPGQSLLLQITGFSGNQVLVRNLGVVDPNNPPPTVTITLPQPATGAPVQATLTTVVPPRTQTPSSSVILSGATERSDGAQSKDPSAAPTTPASASVAPPRAIFVAASVQPSLAAPSEIPEITQRAVAQDVAQLGLEARIAATRAASLDIAELVNTPAKPSTPAVPQQPPATVRTPSPVTQLPPPIVSRAGVPAAQAAPLAGKPSETIAPELALLARLRIPTLPFTLAAARLASNAASALPRVLARLDALLSGVAQGDARAASLRTLLPFVARLDPANVRALPEQLMAFVSNVVDGAEAKAAAIVRLMAQPGAPAAEPELPSANSAPVSRDAQTLAQPQQPSLPAAATPSPAVAAHVAERTVALQYDLKAAIASLAQTSPRGAPPELAPALAQAITTVTAVQLNVLNAQNNDPSTIVIPLPAFYHENGRPAQLRISRDAPNGSGKLDADNFHIAFVLDTHSLGTVAVDVQTASRAVSVSVKTEELAAAGRFRESLDDLRGRLEQLHYRVANVSAGVAPQPRGAAGDSPARDSVEAAPDRAPSNVDLRA
jgi:hypothetical protein